MNKKGVDFRALVYLFTVIFCAILIIVFYLWQGVVAKDASGLIDIASEKVHKDDMLIDLLNYPLDSHKTIGDAVAQGELTKACYKSKDFFKSLYGENFLFVLSFDGDEFCETDESPSKPLKLISYIPTSNDEIKEVNLKI